MPTGRAGAPPERGSAFGFECREGVLGRFLQGGEALAEVGRGAEGKGFLRPVPRGQWFSRGQAPGDDRVEGHS